MTTTLIKNKRNVDKYELMLRLSALHQKFQENEDNANKDKIIQLIKKLKDNEYIIGFCGHFSAGKSSMMNELMKEEVLPSSPIPTSANVVKVKKGRPYARVFYKEEEPVEFPAPYDYDVVKNYCKDGDSILSLEISQEDIDLPEGIAIMDTPGIDSTDDAHRISTESALHLADMILYVMDYNHVQSEQNFMFTKALKERNKPVYLVVNQIDKHNEDELSFESFKAGVEQSFKDWNVDVDGLYFTSLFDKDVPHNQVEELEAFLTQQMENKDELLKESVINAADQLIADHLTFLEKRQEEERSKHEATLSHLDEEEKQNIFSEIGSLESKLHEFDKKESQYKQDFENGLNHILDNAYMMPATTRELARDYIESCQSDFKVGLFFAKKKTEHERRARLAKFYEDLKKKVEAQVDWHVKDYVAKFLKSYQITDESLLSSVYDMTVDITVDVIQRTVKQGAGLTGDYVLNYTNDVANEVKRFYRDAARAKMEEGWKLLANQIQKEQEETKAALEKYEHLKDGYASIQKLEQYITDKGDELENILAGEVTQTQSNDVEGWLQQKLSDEPKIKKQVMEVAQQQKQKADQTKVVAQADDKVELKTTSNQEQSVNTEERKTNTVQQLQQSYELLKDIKGLKAISGDIKSKAERLDNRRFTVALFGAFSAGKSSFANALMGGNVLPVSPNPTTATINKIVPPDETNKHGTVKVKLKTETQLVNDLSYSLQMFGEECSSIDGALKTIDAITYDGENAKEKPHYAFLKAVQAGIKSIEQHIGNEIIVDLDTFKDYVANEEKACFVEWIELYYNCPLTEQGITLVDTPGADSINARHTGVAFEYIKNADAILFVTYYNHAFSKADREFLIQLGRVKETFEMDKMFFVVNAADLAKSEDELNDVVNYVDEQLLNYGIRETRIYPLSSKNALEAKINKQNLHESGIQAFEQDFKKFIIEELTEVAISAAQEEMKHALDTLNDLLQTAKQSDEEKKQQLTKAKETKEEIEQALNKVEINTEERAITQEIEELLYYVKQRVFFRFNDAFNEAFNPSSLREDGRDMKRALQSCLDELIQFMGFDLSQEMRATALRVEKFINQSLKSSHTKLSDTVRGKNEQIRLLSFENQSFDTLEFEAGLQDLDQNRFKTALSMFKNAKVFFEQGGKVKLKEELQNQLDTPVDGYIQTEKDRIKNTYINIFTDTFAALKDKAIDEVNEYYEGIYAVLSEKVDIDGIDQAIQEMNEFVKKDKAV